MGQWIQNELNELQSYHEEQLRKIPKFLSFLSSSPKTIIPETTSLNRALHQNFQSTDELETMDQEISQSPNLTLIDSSSQIILTDHYLVQISGKLPSKNYQFLILSRIHFYRTVIMQDPYTLKNHGKEYYIDLMDEHRNSLGSLILRKDGDYHLLVDHLSTYIPTLACIEAT